VVATRSGGQVEIVRDGETGALVAPNRPAELATAIAALTADPSGRARLGQRARALVERDLTWERHVDALEKVYQQAQQARHPPTDAALV
jgi:glycosyltransferase involved in cell wall biosynthesis